MQDKNIKLQKLLDFEQDLLGQTQQELLKIFDSPNPLPHQKIRIAELQKITHDTLKKIYASLSHWQRTLVARHENRPQTLDYIPLLFENFTQIHGDRNFGDDPSLICGLASLQNHSVVIVGHQKGKGMKDSARRNYGMAHPEGYRKALRLFKLASKFNKPIFTFVDTPGAYPGKGGEERGQAEAIARNLKEMFSLKVPVISTIIGEGGSGGAIGIAVANHLIMLENSIYSVISPESCSAILWRDAAHKKEAAAALKNDPKTALKFAIIDEIIKEPTGGAHRNHAKIAQDLKKSLLIALKNLQKLTPKKLSLHRQQKFAKMATSILRF